mmetsp:Transcript_162278/g.515546  ORF Transcript_162278/g.515546 Transcript_162278/m.515546 type:complete len:263 (-) Transcript_162278:25-813(-)
MRWRHREHWGTIQPLFGNRNVGTTIAATSEGSGTRTSLVSLLSTWNSRAARTWTSLVSISSMWQSMLATMGAASGDGSDIHVDLLYCAVLDLLVGKDVAKLLLDGIIQLLPILLHPHNTIGVGLASSGPPLPSLCLLFVRLLLIEVAALRIRGREHVVEFLVDIIRRATALCRHLSRYRLVGLAVLWIVQIIRQVIFCAALGNLVDVAASNMLVCLPAWLEVCRQGCLAYRCSSLTLRSVDVAPFAQGSANFRLRCNRGCWC